MKDYLGKWVYVKPVTREGSYIGRAQILFVHKETAKQVRASVCDREVYMFQHRVYMFPRRVYKRNIVRTIPAGDVDRLREEILVAQNEYDMKRSQLFARYHKLMCSIE